jgi:hypothetical protein
VVNFDEHTCGHAASRMSRRGVGAGEDLAHPAVTQPGYEPP